MQARINELETLAYCGIATVAERMELENRTGRVYWQESAPWYKAPVAARMWGQDAKRLEKA